MCNDLEPRHRQALSQLQEVKQTLADGLSLLEHYDHDADKANLEALGQKLGKLQTLLPQVEALLA